MKKLLREPLLHFLALGAGLFALNAWIGGRNNLAQDEIVISQGQVANLVAGFERLRQRPPTRAELDGLVEGTIREEVFYREALALDLGEDDVIVRRRLMQKLEFVSEDVNPVAEPSDAQLQEYMRARPERFRDQRRYSLEQVYLNPQRRGASLDDDAQALLVELRGVKDAAGRGDTFLLDERIEGMEGDEIARLYGKDFELALRDLPIGTWQGPVTSGYGLHLVLLREREDDRPAALADIRDEVRREWMYAQRKQANDKYYAELRKRYEVTVEALGRPVAQAGGASAQAAGKRE